MYIIPFGSQLLILERETNKQPDVAGLIVTFRDIRKWQKIGAFQADSAFNNNIIIINITIIIIIYNT